jgi:hypothetical protein
MKERIIVSRLVLPERSTGQNAGAASISATQATVAVAAFSLISAIGTAWITGAFDRQASVESASIATASETAIAEIRAEADSRVEEIKRLSAVGVEQTRLQGNIEIEKFKLQRDLILQAIETDDSEEAKIRLGFFARTGLIPDFETGVLNFISDDTAQLPSLASTSGRRFPASVQSMDSVTVSPLEALVLSHVGVLTYLEAASEFHCNATLITPQLLIVPQHCATDPTSPNLVFFNIPTNAIGPVPTQSGIKAHKLSFLGNAVGAQELGDNVYLFGLSDTIAGISGSLATREPVNGEVVSMIGWAPSDFEVLGQATLAVPRGLTLETIAHSRAVVHRNCRILGTDNGIVRTDCISSQGMSGAAIFSVDDGALLTLVAYGAEAVGPTAGPLLSGVSALVPDEVK